MTLCWSPRPCTRRRPRWAAAGHAHRAAAAERARGSDHRAAEVSGGRSCRETSALDRGARRLWRT
eukprot:7074798-Prymnesium_polylepis.1